MVWVVAVQISRLETIDAEAGYRYRLQVTGNAAFEICLHLQEPGATVLIQTVTKIVNRLEGDTSILLALPDSDLEAEAELEASEQGEDVLGCIVGLSRVCHLLEACPEPAKQEQLRHSLASILKVLHQTAVGSFRLSQACSTRFRLCCSMERSLLLDDCHAIEDANNQPCIERLPEATAQVCLVTSCNTSSFNRESAERTG